MRRLLLILCVVLVCTAFAACAPSTPDTQGVPHNPPTLIAPTQYVAAQQPVTLNNVANLKYLGRLDQPGTVSTIFSYALSPDATRLVALNNEEILAWNLLNGSILFQTSRSDATRVFYSSDKTEVYAVNAGGTVTVLDANTGAIKNSFSGSPTYSGSIAFSADDGWLAFGGTDGTVKVWDTYGRQALATISADAGAISALAFSADGTQVATAGNDGLVRVWHWRDSSKTAEIALDLPITTRQVAFAPDASSLAIGTNRDARLWSLSSPKQIDTLDVGRGGAVQILQFSPDGRYLLAGNQSAGLSLWTVTSRALGAHLPDTQGDTLAAAFSPDGNLLLTAVLNGKVSLWNLVQVTASTVGQKYLDVGTQQILNVEWTDDSRLLMFFDASGPVYLWGIGA